MHLSSSREAKISATRLGKDKVLAVVIFCSLSAYISLYLIIGLFAHPAADDYWFANKVIAEGFLQSQLSWYTGWTGRYASTGLISSYLTIFNLIESFWLVPVLLLITTLASFYLVFISLPDLTRNDLPPCIGVCTPPFEQGWLSMQAGSGSLPLIRLPKMHFGSPEAVCAGLIMTALYLSGVPSTSEVFYWLAGGITYQLGNCLYLLLVVALMKLLCGNPDTVKRAFWLASPLVVIIAGMNETIMLLQSLTLMLALTLAFRVKPQQHYPITGLLLLSLVAAAVVIAAPGNAVRAGNFHLTHDIIFSLKNSVFSAVSHALSWSASVPLWLATLIWVPLASATMRASNAARLQRRCAVIAALVWLSLLAATYFPAFWSMGAAPPTRTLSTTYMIFIVGWFLMVTWIAALIPLREGIFSVGCLRFISVIFGVVLFTTGNGATACKDLAIAPRYSEQLNNRYSLLAASSGAKPSGLKVPALQDHPATIAIHFGDISADKDDWKNKNYANYFHLNSVATTWVKL